MRSPLASPLRDRNRGMTGLRGRGRGGAAWSPANLAPYAWYDANIGGSSTQIADSSGNARAAATNGATSAAATWLPYSTPAVYLTGVASSYISTPDSVALSFSNDIEVVCRVRCVDWSATANQTIVGKYLATGNQRSWRFYSTTAGAIGLSVSQDGSSTVTTVTVTPSVALTDNAWVWLRLRLDLTNGSNSVGTVDTAADTGSNEDVPTSWTANGTATSTTIAAIFDSTAALEIGSFSAGATERFNGWIGRVIVRNGFAGTDVADFNATICGQTGYTGALGNVWTVSRPATGLKTVVQSPAANSTRSLFLLGTDDYFTVPASAKPGLGASDESTWLVVYRRWATFGSGSRVFDDRNSATDTVAGIGLRSGFGTPADLAVGIGNGTTNAGGAGPSQFATGVLDVSGAVVATTSLAATRNGSVSSSYARTGSGTNANNLTIGAIGTPGNYIDFELVAVLLFNRQLTATELAALVTYCGAGS